MVKRFSKKKLSQIEDLKAKGCSISQISKKMKITATDVKTGLNKLYEMENQVKSVDTKKNENIFYGKDLTNDNAIEVDRKKLHCGEGFITGNPGGGVDFVAKREMKSVLDQTDDNIVINDVNGDYVSFTKELDGKVIPIFSEMKEYINPLDPFVDCLDLFIYGDILEVKIDLIGAIFEQLIGSLSDEEVECIANCTKELYRPYVKEPIPENIPLLQNLYHALKHSCSPIGENLADILQTHLTTGSLKMFSHPTTVHCNHRICCFDLSSLKPNYLKTIGLLVVQQYAVGQMIHLLNDEKKQCTRYYCTEIDRFDQENISTHFFIDSWKRFKILGGITTGISNQLNKILRSQSLKDTFWNARFLMVLSLTSADSEKVMETLKETYSSKKLAFLNTIRNGQGFLMYHNNLYPINVLGEKRAENDHR